MKYTRIDHSNDLIHFTKDSDNWDFQKSYERFLKIVKDGFLEQASYLRLGDIPSICFTEASYAALTENGNLNKKYFERYSPFGFMFSKKYIYNKGGLPVIYSPKHDFEKDNDKTNWRTVTYNPVGPSKTLFRDYTWEREWRIKPTDKILELYPEHTKLIFPSHEWAEKFRNDHDAEHKLDSCDCICARECKIINYDRYLSGEENGMIKGTCDESIQFPWILLNMNCENIPEPK